MTKQWPQFSLRSLLIALSLAAVALAIYLQRPTSALLVDLADDGSIQIEGRLIDRDTLGDRLKSELNYRKIWLTDCDVQIQADEKYSEIHTVIELIQGAGIENITLAFGQDKVIFKK